MNRLMDREYHRYTAVLREDNPNYAKTPAKRPGGKATIEITGKSGILKCSVRNLRPLNASDIKKEYEIWVRAEETKKNIPVYAGIIEINNKGVGESLISFEPDRLQGSGLNLGFGGILEVCVNTAPKDDLPGDRVLVGELELEEADLSEEPKMEKVSPFGTGLPYHHWWKFYPGNFQNMVVFSQNNQNSGSYGPVFRGHQLIGLQYAQDAVKYLVHGVPGRFCLRDQPCEGATGYVYWHPLPGQQYKPGDYGYWLIYIDPATGEVVFPDKAIKPPDCLSCEKE
ncbi:hypothetical protein [Phosphitispora sp. TUW77]|uniref:hypothetical protein n=1 Tax=Phosphitispora sp. TUW77 TaxID=3152361 RepID=UPI003AB7F0E7